MSTHAYIKLVPASKKENDYIRRSKRVALFVSRNDEKNG